MAKTRVQKQTDIKNLTDKMIRAKAIFFADFKGMTMSQLSDLRNKLLEQDAQFIITKNTLVKIALNRAKFTYPDTIASTFEGSTATLFEFNDEISPLKILAKTIKETAVGKIKAGFLNGVALDSTSVQRLATLPTKDELKSKVVGILAAPLQGMVSVLQGNLRNLVYALSEIQKMKGGV